MSDDDGGFTLPSASERGEAARNEAYQRMDELMDRMHKGDPEDDGSDPELSAREMEAMHNTARNLLQLRTSSDDESDVSDDESDADAGGDRGVHFADTVDVQPYSPASGAMDAQDQYQEELSDQPKPLGTWESS